MTFLRLVDLTMVTLIQHFCMIDLTQLRRIGTNTYASLFTYLHPKKIYTTIMVIIVMDIATRLNDHILIDFHFDMVIKKNVSNNK